MCAAPRMLHYLRDRVPLVDVPVEHSFDQIDGCVTHNPGNTELVVHDFVDAVEGVFFVYKSVQQDTERPHILFSATVGFTLQHLGRCVVYSVRHAVS